MSSQAYPWDVRRGLEEGGRVRDAGVNWHGHLIYGAGMPRVHQIPRARESLLHAAC